MKRGLGLTLLPSPDPVSLAFNAASILGPLIKSLLGTGHLEANQIVPVQNKLHSDVLAPAVAAKDNPNTSTADLIFWRNVLRQEGEAFYHFTENFAQAGPGARRTIFGIQDAAGNWITTSAALGIATQILRDFNTVILQRTGDMSTQLGIDWGRLIQSGVDLAGTLTGRPLPPVIIGGPYVPPSEQPPLYTAYNQLPSWLLPAGIALLAIVLLKKK